VPNKDFFRRLPGPEDSLPESPCWHEKSGRIFWVDHGTSVLNSVGLPGEVYRPIKLETEGNLRFVQSAETNLLIGSERGLYLFDPETDILTDYGPDLPLSPETCINDGALGPEGTVVIAISDLSEEQPLGGFYKLSAEGWACIEANIIVANGPAFSPCGDYLYMSDTFGRRILKHDIAYEHNTVFCDLSDRKGYPDGLITTPAGALCVSYWAASAVEVLTPDGALFRRFEISLPNATCAALFDHLGTQYLAVTACTDNGDGGLVLQELEPSEMP